MPRVARMTALGGAAVRRTLFTQQKWTPEMTYTPDCTYDLADPDMPSQEELAETRRHLLTDLRALSLAQIEVQYFADEDTAHVETISVLPATASIAEDLQRRAAAFGLDFTFSVNLGVKHALSNQGTLTWDLLSDSIDIVHSETYVAVENTTHNGL